MTDPFPIGSNNPKLLIVGEAPGETEERKRVPFVGASGRMLGQLLYEAGLLPISPSDSATPDELTQIWEDSGHRLTNVIFERPKSNNIDSLFLNKTEAKKHNLSEVMGRYPTSTIRSGAFDLYSEIDATRPNLILALGNTSLWALTGETSVTSWRGSIMESIEIQGRTYKVIPTIHPALIFRMFNWRPLIAHDIKERVAKEYTTPEIPDPGYNFIVAPDKSTTLTTLDGIISKLDSGPLRLSSDIETRWKQIACVGLAWSDRDAISIPLMRIEEPYHYFDYETEVEVVSKLAYIHTHPNARIVGQNFNFDREYFARLWGFRSNLYMDTMTAHHVCWPALRKGLEFLSSLYCRYHRYWKDESGEWDPKIGEMQFWEYNCKDVVVTYEVSIELEDLVEKMGMEEQVNFQHRMEEHVFTSWLRGVNYDDKNRRQMGLDLTLKMHEYENWFIDMLDGEASITKSDKYWFNSPGQLNKLFYDQLGIKPVKNRKTGRPTTKAEAMPTIKKREPLVGPICDAILEYRSLRVYYSTFVQVSLDSGMRFRAELDVNGTETIRFSSRSDGFGKGANMQNIPGGKEE